MRNLLELIVNTIIKVKILKTINNISLHDIL